MKKPTYYIFTEIVNCGKIGKIALDSFHKYHNYPVHVYGTKDDFQWLIPHKNNILIEINDKILDGYVNGHMGTALLWEEVFKNTGEQYLLHFDSDVIFRGNMVDFMIEKSKEYDIIGPMRNYHHNPNNRKDIRHLADLCQTNCSLWNKEKISKNLFNKKIFKMPSVKTILSLSPFQILKTTKHFLGLLIYPERRKMSKFAKMIQGTYSPFPFGHIDFFDPIMFDMVLNGAKIYHLDFDEVGGCDYYGKRDNKFKEINNFPTQYKLDFGNKLVHFSCVGSGMNFHTHPERQKNVSIDYVNASLDRYALYCKIFYKENLKGIDLSAYESIINIPKWY